MLISSSAYSHIAEMPRALSKIALDSSLIKETKGNPEEKVSALPEEVHFKLHR